MDELMEDRFSKNDDSSNAFYEAMRSTIFAHDKLNFSDVSAADDDDDRKQDFFSFNYSSYPIDEYPPLLQPDMDSLWQIDDIIEPHKVQEEKRRNLIIWDWDDTIYPTTAFKTGAPGKDKAFWTKLELLMSCVETVFSAMIKKYGAQNIIIVTNGSPTWIKKCLNHDLVKDIMQSLQKLFVKNKIECISASTAEIKQKYPWNYLKWKEIAFAKLFKRFFNETDEDMVNCITSIGDSVVEYKASHTASKHLKNRILNRIRFKPHPSIDDLICQMKEMLTIYDQFGVIQDDMDLENQFLTSNSSNLIISSSSETSFSSFEETESKMNDLNESS